MERLTDKMLTEACNDPWDYCGLDAHCTRHCTQPTPCKIPALVHRLAKIENILGDNYDLDELREMVQAKREGRCVVLPCKIGQKVYDITSGEVIEKSVVSIPFLLSKSINHLCLHAINQRDAITEIGTQDFGKTVFFTRAEAEAALRREQE